MTGHERAALEILREAAQPLGGLEIVRRSRGKLGRGTVYVALQNLIDDGLAVATDVPGTDPPSRLFEICDNGRRALADVPGAEWSPA